MRPRPERREDILTLIICGHTSTEIAKLLDIPHSTVRYHISIILTKYNARTVAQAVYRWMLEKQEHMA